MVSGFDPPTLGNPEKSPLGVFDKEPEDDIGALIISFIIRLVVTPFKLLFRLFRWLFRRSRRPR